MKILIRSKQTQLYYAGKNGWRSQQDQAVPLPSSLDAWKLILKDTMREDLELVYAFENSGENFSVPIEPPLLRARPEGCARH